MVNDIRLNRQFLETGNEDVFTLVFNNYYQAIYDYVDGMMRDHPDPAVDADDITSETFAKAFEERKDIREPEKLLWWLRTTARNLLNDTMRASKRYLPVESLDGFPASESDAPSASILGERASEQDEANRYLLQRLFRLLSHKDREIVEFMLDGFSPKEIAETIDSTPEAVQKRWERIRKWLCPIGLYLDALVNCLPEEDDRKIMERYLDGEPLLEIAKAIGISCSDIEESMKRVIANWKKAAKQNPMDPVSAMVKKER